MTHDDLIEIGARWLRDDRRCHVVLTEPKAPQVIECPDVIGWDYSTNATVIECKVSKADFRADQDKAARGIRGGMGSFRFFLAPLDLLTVGETFDLGWGLVQVGPDGMIYVDQPQYNYKYPDLVNERRVLVQALCQLQRTTKTEARQARTGNLKFPNQDQLAQAHKLLAEDPNLTAKELAREIKHPGKTANKFINDLLRARSEGKLDFPLTTDSIKDDQHEHSSGHESDPVRAIPSSGTSD